MPALGTALGLTLSLTLGALSGMGAPSATPASSHPDAGRHGETGVVAPPVLSASRARVASGRWQGALDTADRVAVDAAYRSDFAAGLSTPTGFTGDVSSCRAGDSSVESRAATLRAVNFARSLAGLAPVTFSATLDARAQLTALMMSANHRLDHAPPSSWRCWTRTGADNAGRSNLALASPSLTSAGLVRMYLDEPGSTNTAVGHRRWLLNPFSTEMGSGSTDDANALTVIGPTSATRPNPAYVSWPTAGWFPAPLEPDGRWSLSAGNRRTSFARASVRVYRNGTLVPTTRYAVHNGYAQPTLVWQLPDSVAKSGTFHVEVTGIRIGRKARKHSWSYDVSMFSPSS